MARLTTDIKSFGRHFDLVLLVAAGIVAIVSGIFIGIMIERQSQCPRGSYRTIATPTLSLQAGAWVTERLVADRISR